MTRKQKRDAKNARHRKNQERRGLRRIVNRCLAYTWNWSYAAQNQEALEWLNWDQKQTRMSDPQAGVVLC